MCNSVGPCSRHRRLHITEINSGQGQSSKNYVIFLKISSPTIFWYMYSFSAPTVGDLFRADGYSPRI